MNEAHQNDEVPEKVRLAQQKLGRIAELHGIDMPNQAELKDDEAMKSPSHPTVRLQAVTTLAPGTVREILLGNKHTITRNTFAKLDKAILDGEHNRRGYRQQTTEDKRSRLIGAIGMMSEHAVHDLFPVIMQMVIRDGQAEFSGKFSGEDDEYRQALDGLRRALASAPAVSALG